jgi:hypothetical protein
VEQILNVLFERPRKLIELFDESFRRRVSEHAYGSECEQARDLAAAPEPEKTRSFGPISPALPNHATANVIGT